MRYLEELEQKVLLLIERNRDLQVRLDASVKECALLREQNKQVEDSLLKEAHATSLLTQEKDAIAQSIESLLNSINNLENSVG